MSYELYVAPDSPLNLVENMLNELNKKPRQVYLKSEWRSKIK